MNTIQPFLLKIFNGPPDLTVDVVPAKSGIYGGPVPGMPQDSSSVTITVRNQLWFFPGPIKLEDPNIHPAYGSDANNVMVRVNLSTSLQQAGNISLPAGFSATVAPNQQVVFIYGGTFPAGASVDFVIEVIGGTSCGTFESIQAQVDPYSYIVETSKTNNMGSATIFVWDYC